MNIYKLPVVEIGECVHKNKHNCVDVDFFTLFLTTISLKDTKNTTGSNEQGCFFYIKKIIIYKTTSQKGGFYVKLLKWRKQLWRI